MNFKKTLIFSVILHLCFLTAVLFLSADLLGNSSKMFNEEVFFIKLVEDIINKSEGRQSVVETKEQKPGITQQVKAEKKPFVDIQNKTISVETETGDGNNHDSYKDDLDKQRKFANNVLLANYKTGEDNVIDIPYGQETDIKGSLDLSVPGNDGISKNKKGLSAGIIEIIRNSIEKAKIYPILARKRGIEGTVYISFRVNSEGKPNDIKILNSSGSHILDNATLDIVKKAAPFPHIDSFVEVPVVFRLN